MEKGTQGNNSQTIRAGGIPPPKIRPDSGEMSERTGVPLIDWIYANLHKTNHSPLIGPTPSPGDWGLLQFYRRRKSEFMKTMYVPALLNKWRMKPEGRGGIDQANSVVDKSEQALLDAISRNGEAR